MFAFDMKRSQMILVILLAAVACRQPYDPPVVSSGVTYLVVEANLNPQGLTSILLTKSVPLERANSISPEVNAQVTVEGKDNTIRPLAHIGNGRYNNSNLALTIGNEYRLHIKTVGGKEYFSEYVKARKTPVIDSIGYELESEGLRVQAHAHDATNQTRYYRWDFDETWEIRSVFPSPYIYDNTIKDIRNRIYPDEDVSVCWKYESSSTIVLANTTRLQNDIVYKAPVQFIPNGSEKLAVRYSILLRQYSLEKAAYNFYELMRKNTEDIGNIFSPQPSEIRGNISNVNDSKEYVLGYVTASTVESRRTFIQIPWRYFQDCQIYKVPDIPDSVKFYFGPGGPYIPFAFDEPPPTWSGSSLVCVDCTLRGGNTTKPSYW
jgi:hypothetical protein